MEDQCTETLRSLLFDLPGWAGMFERMEEHHREAPHSIIHNYNYIIWHIVHYIV